MNLVAELAYKSLPLPILPPSRATHRRIAGIIYMRHKPLGVIELAALSREAQRFVNGIAPECAG